MTKQDYIDAVRIVLIVLVLLIALAGLYGQAESAGEPLPPGTIAHLAYTSANRHKLPVNSADRLVCIAWHESRFNPGAVSPGGWYYGTMQFGQYLWMVYAPDLGYSPYLEAALDPVAAVDVAAYIASKPNGWRNWSPVNDGRC